MQEKCVEVKNIYRGLTRKPVDINKIWRDRNPTVIYMVETPPWHVYGPIICMDSVAIMISCVRPFVYRANGGEHIIRPFSLQLVNLILLSSGWEIYRVICISSSLVYFALEKVVSVGKGFANTTTITYSSVSIRLYWTQVEGGKEILLRSHSKLDKIHALGFRR